MSGGLFDYQDRDFAFEMFKYNAPGRGETFELSKDARHWGPFKGELALNEMLWDMLCLLHEYDWYQSGDTDIDAWKAAKKTFHTKWGKSSVKYKKELIADECERLKEQLLEELGDA